MSRDEVYLRHVLDAIETIEGYVLVGFDEFMRETHWQDAVVRRLEVIGEAVSEFRRRFGNDGPRSRGGPSQACETF